MTAPSRHTDAADTPSVDPVAPGAGPLESASEWLSCIALIAMIVLIGAEALIRNLLGTSLQITDEVCGYLLVAVTFLSMSVSEAHGAFHRVELVQSRLSERRRLWLQMLFDVCALAASAVVSWQLGRLALKAWRAEDVAPTPLQTPLWIPQAAMVIGMTILCLTLLRSLLAKYRRIAATEGGLA